MSILGSGLAGPFADAAGARRKTLGHVGELDLKDPTSFPWQRDASASSGVVDPLKKLLSQTFPLGVKPFAVRGGVASLRGRSSRLGGETKLSEHLDGPGLPSLEIARGKALPRGELISGTQDRLWRITVAVPD